MNLHINIKGTSKIMLTLMMLISAVIGGIISYTFTIAYYAKIPEETAITITGIHINPKNVKAFNITVLNPSYSPKSANITRIAISMKDGAQLYDVIETNPPIKRGLEIRVGESVNITCSKIRKDNANVTFGEFVSTFPGEIIVVHVFAEGSPAANKEVRLPCVKIEITADFNPRISLNRFNITLTNNPQSEVNLTITWLRPGLIEFKEVRPDFRLNPVFLPRGETICFQFNGSWYTYKQFLLEILTEQGYIFRKDITLLDVNAIIHSVTFNENQVDRFNVTVYNLASSVPLNVMYIECTLENGTKLPPFNCDSAEIMPNTTRTFTFDWNWREYRGKIVTVVAYFVRDFTTPLYEARTPSPVIAKVLNTSSAFNLRDKGRFNITILNHVSSIEAVNITKIVVKKTNDTLSVADGLINPGNNKTFTCNFNWAKFLVDYGRNLTLTVYAIGNETMKEYTFDFCFILPVAELDITAISSSSVGGVGYLNLTVRNMDYSVWNLTLSKIVITIQDSAESLEYLFPKNHIVLIVGSEIILLCPFNWQNYVGENITVTVVTEEHVETSVQYTVV
ncbi:MAG: hypothetical protein QXQ61_03495 [Candidatus Bathyarchaeia archaeon]